MFLGLDVEQLNNPFYSMNEYFDQCSYILIIQNQFLYKYIWIKVTPTLRRLKIPKAVKLCKVVNYLCISITMNYNCVAAAINSCTNLKVLAPPLGHMGLNDVILSVLEDSAAAQLAVRVACTPTISAPITHHNNAKLWLELSGNNYCKWNYGLMESADATHKVPGSAYI